MAQPKRATLFGNLFMVFYWFLSLDIGLWTVSAATGNEIGYCAPYHGKVCKSFITSTQVWYNKVSKRSIWIVVYRNKGFSYQCFWRLNDATVLLHDTICGRVCLIYICFIWYLICCYAGRSIGRMGK